MDYKSISKKMEISLETVESLASEIKKLEPYPATLYTSNKPDYVIPDVIVREVEGEFDIYINDEWIPRLKINKEYKNILKNAKESDRDYITSKLGSAEWLIRSVNQRRQTLFKVTSAIIEMQTEFFQKGIQYIKPLTLKDIAEKLEMHESTISRITSNKYIQTSRGIMELKWFFPPEFVLPKVGSNLLKKFTISFEISSKRSNPIILCPIRKSWKRSGNKESKSQEEQLPNTERS
ncbi:RNA polymerase sigma-54 factor family protein [Leptospira weilii serovar Topaz str. LT2116]|uniref:RNA polymerase sigma-54 factor family protein n=1 Tax=Leptospira weilii serovar Topaz str. LT2116 TaxID=1088540 RepID=M3GY36_9LEPT|nr:RNA polymerase sigma-54 factor family protein [Leptospira weilii serovar Topaz str. LT2116]